MAKDDAAERNPLPDLPSRSGTTRLGSTMTFTGELEGHEDLLVEGRVTGKITLPSGTLTVAKGARVEAEITVRGLVLHGELVGNVTAAERVQVAETGQMTGDVTTPRISILNGARFKGGIRMEKS